MRRAWIETPSLMGLSATATIKTKSGPKVEVTLSMDLTPEGWSKALRGLIEVIWVEAVRRDPRASVCVLGEQSPFPYLTT